MARANKTYLPPALPFINGIALLLWGWECNYLIYAIPMAILLESARFIPWKISITNNEFNYIADLSSIIFLFVAIYIFIENTYHGIYIILSLLPLLLFLLVLAQVYSIQGFIKPSALFISLRKTQSTGSDIDNLDIDLSYPYFFICVIAASAGNQQPVFFYISVVILLSLALWCLKPPHTATFVWLPLILFTAISGYGGQIGMTRLQSIAEATFLNWFDQFMWHNRDPRRTSTAIGSLGKLKQSDRIVLRVDPHATNLHLPLLVREATYINYSYGVWTNYQEKFRLIDKDTKNNQWILNQPSKKQHRLSIVYYLDDQTAVVPAPQGTETITNVTASQIEYSPYGIISLEFNPGWIKYDALYNRDMVYDAEPGIDDLDVPEMYKADLQQLSNQLKLDAQSAPVAVDTVKHFFAENFKYSLTQNERYPRGKYLSRFLFDNRKGHCEYFATATALLLRTAGIPARYVIGYSVSEYSPLEKQYIARARHAHSWVLAYVDGKWQTVDTTPSIWASEEEMDVSALEPLVDLWSWFSYRISVWNASDENKISDILIWLLIPLSSFYIWNILKKKKKANKNMPAQELPVIKKPGVDTAFYKLAEEIGKKYIQKKPGQTLQQWILILENTSLYHDMKELVFLHYKNRFDPDGLTEEQKKLMNLTIENKLSEFNK